MAGCFMTEHSRRDFLKTSGALAATLAAGSLPAPSRSNLLSGETELKATDFVEESLTRFVAAVRGEGAPLMTLADGVANLRMQMEILRVGA